MQGALCNKLLTIYATAKTGWEVNPPFLTLSLSVCLSVCLSLSLSLCASVSVSSIFLFLPSSMLFKREANGIKSACLSIYVWSWSPPPVWQFQSRRSLQGRLPETWGTWETLITTNLKQCRQAGGQTQSSLPHHYSTREPKCNQGRRSTFWARSSGCWSSCRVSHSHNVPDACLQLVGGNNG